MISRDFGPPRFVAVKPLVAVISIIVYACGQLHESQLRFVDISCIFVVTENSCIQPLKSALWWLRTGTTSGHSL